MLLVVLAFSFVLNTSANSIKQEREKQAQIEAEIKQQQQEKAKLENSKSQNEALIREIDAKVNAIAAKILDYQNRVDEKELEIKDTQARLEEAEIRLVEQYESMKLRIQFMYENGNQKYLDMILGSESMGDFLNKAEYITQITEYDRNMMNQMIETKEEIERTRIALQEEKKDLEDLVAQQKKQQDQAMAEVAQKRKEVRAYDYRISVTENTISDKEEELEAQKALVKEMEEIERRRREEEARRAAEARLKYDGGIFEWPVPGIYRISSGYGYRTDPITGQRGAFHNGIDIPGPVGTPIVAAYDGEVAWARYSTTAGNWIGIDHGDGLYTVYMHNSAMLVSQGQKVKKGQRIALMGSTGRSTGPHLHFSVRKDGQYVNPNQYVGR